MAKFLCKCGNLIGFNADPLRYEGAVRGDSVADTVNEMAAKEVASYLSAVQAGQREEWLQKFYGSTFEIGDADVVSDILSRHLMFSSRVIHQGEQCGRLWLQRKPGENIWNAYLPEGDWRGALEANADGFLRYVEDMDLYGARIEDVRQAGEAARVSLLDREGKLLEVAFSGVTAIQMFEGASSKSVRFLSEWQDAPPLRRFRFDSTCQRTESLLEIIAGSVSLQNQDSGKPDQ